MAWYDEAIFYHIYPLGMKCAPKRNSYSVTEHRLNNLLPFVSQIKNIGCNSNLTSFENNPRHSMSVFLGILHWLLEIHLALP